MLIFLEKNDMKKQPKIKQIVVRDFEDYAPSVYFLTEDGKVIRQTFGENNANKFNIVEFPDNVCNDVIEEKEPEVKYV